MNTSDNKQYSREFKIGIVKVIKEQDRSITEMAEEIDVHANRIRHWVKQYDDDTSDSYPGYEVIELCQLKQENIRLRSEQEILKQTIHIFSKEKK